MNNRSFISNKAVEDNRITQPIQNSMMSPSQQYPLSRNEFTLQKQEHALFKVPSVPTLTTSPLPLLNNTNQPNKQHFLPEINNKRKLSDNLSDVMKGQHQIINSNKRLNPLMNLYETASQNITVKNDKPASILELHGHYNIRSSIPFYPSSTFKLNTLFLSNQIKSHQKENQQLSKLLSSQSPPGLPQQSLKSNSTRQRTLQDAIRVSARLPSLPNVSTPFVLQVNNRKESKQSDSSLLKSKSNDCSLISKKYENHSGFPSLRNFNEKDNSTISRIIQKIRVSADKNSGYFQSQFISSLSTSASNSLDKNLILKIKDKKSKRISTPKRMSQVRIIEKDSPIERKNAQIMQDRDTNTCNLDENEDQTPRRLNELRRYYDEKYESKIKSEQQENINPICKHNANKQNIHQEVEELNPWIVMS